MYSVGDSVYVYRWGGYMSGRVVKVSPSGLVDVLIGAATEPTRFRKDGREQGAKYGGYQLDELAFEARTTFLVAEKAAQKTVEALKQVRCSELCNYHWGKDGLMAEVARLQALLDLARAKVEAI